MGRYNYNYEIFKNKFGETLPPCKEGKGEVSNSRQLTREAEIELKYNSIKRIQPFLRKLEKWMAEVDPFHPRIGCCLNYAA